MNDGEIIRTAELAATREDVWRHLTEAGLLAQWLGEDARLETLPRRRAGAGRRLGGRRTGWIEEVEPARRLCFWWRGADEDDATRVALELRDVPGGTRITVTESRPMAAIELRAAELHGDSRYGAGGARRRLRRRRSSDAVRSSVSLRARWCPGGTRPGGSPPRPCP